MKNRNIFLILGASMCLAAASVFIYARNVNISKDFNNLKTSSIASLSGISIREVGSENRDQIDSLYAASSIRPEIKKQNLQCNVSVSNGFDALYTEEERTLYSKIKIGCNKILNNKSEAGYELAPVTVKGKNIKSPVIKKVLYALINDNPELFWISKSFRYGYYNGSTVLILHSNFSKEEKEKAVNNFNDKVLEIISQIPEGASEYEKELFLHDYIIDNCKYSKEALNRFSAYGCLVEGNAVCEGYSRATQILLSRVGIESRFVSGTSKSEMHSWNMLKLNDKWYHLDVTGDSGGEYQRYNYFNVSDDVIKWDHIISEQLPPSQIWPQDKMYNFSLPVCNSVEENYFEKNAVKVSTSADLGKITNKLIEVAKNKKNLLFVKVDKKSNVNRVKNELISSKIFEYINKANSVLENEINASRVYHSMCEPQNVIIIRFNYNS